MTETHDGIAVDALSRARAIRALRGIAKHLNDGGEKGISQLVDYAADLLERRVNVSAEKAVEAITAAERIGWTPDRNSASDRQAWYVEMAGYFGNMATGVATMRLGGDSRSLRSLIDRMYLNTRLAGHFGRAACSKDFIREEWRTR